MRALTRVEQHFAFGDNWASYARLITEEHVARAVAAIERLLGDIDLNGRTFLDIGCGSGIHAVAATRLGCSRVVAIDIDEQSVATARATLASMAPNADATTLTASILDSSPAELGVFDVVYSWGVLHHSGAMWEALEKAAALVAPGGILAIALYRKTPLCGAWRIEKRMYSRAPRWIQASLVNGYVGLYRLKCLLTGRDFQATMEASKQQRGMDYRHDVHDWLGGYPYESASPEEVHAHLARLGFAPVREFCQSAGLGFTVHCDEYVARRSSPS